MNDTEPDQQPSSESTERYRRRAERLVGQTLEEPEIDPRELLHELRVHQVELEMQIDELRESEQRQQRLLERAEDLFDHAPVALLTADPTGMILRTNRDARRLLGMAVRGTHRPLMVAVERDDHHAVRQLLDAALAGQPAAARVTLRARQGRRIHVDLRANRLRTTDESTELLVSVTDLTEHDQLAQTRAEAERLEAIDHLAAGMAHDFNNLLTVVLGHLSLLELDLTDERLKRLAMDATVAAQKGSDAVGKLLAFARRQQLRPSEVSLPTLLDEMRPSLRRHAGLRCQIVFELDDGLPAAHVDETALRAAIVSLVVNAAQASHEGGTIRIGARTLPAGEHGQGPRQLELRVQDQGTGMDTEVLARATEPFFTTKESSEGSGLGLSMVRGFAEQSGGAIALDSTPGEGTTVRLHLPATG